MKIKKFNENTSNKVYHTFAHFNYSDAIMPDFYIFENEQDAFNFLANKLYPIYSLSKLDLNILDDCEDAVELIEQYEEEVNNNGTIDTQLIYYTPTPISDREETPSLD